MWNIQIFLDRSLIFVRLNTIGYPNSSVIKAKLSARIFSFMVILHKHSSAKMQIHRDILDSEIKSQKTILLFAHYKLDQKLILKRLGKLNGFLTRFCHCFCSAPYYRSKMMDMQFATKIKWDSWIYFIKTFKVRLSSNNKFI